MKSLHLLACALAAAVGLQTGAAAAEMSPPKTSLTRDGNCASVYSAEGALLSDCTLTETITDVRADGEELEITYRYDVILSRASGGSSTEYDSDSTYSVTAYNTITWQSTSYGDAEYVKLTKMSGYWTSSDPNVGISSATLTYHCSGPTPSKDGVIQTNSKSVGNNYTVYTGFSNYVARDGGGSTIGASLAVTLKSGGNRWTFYVSNSIANADMGYDSPDEE